MATAAHHTADLGTATIRRAEYRLDIPQHGNTFDAHRLLSPGQERGLQAKAAAHGISGVPFFVVENKYGVSGAQPADSPLQAMRLAWQEANPLKVLASGGESGLGDSCAG